MYVYIYNIYIYIYIYNKWLKNDEAPLVLSIYLLSDKLMFFLCHYIFTTAGTRFVLRYGQEGIFLWYRDTVRV